MEMGGVVCLLQRVCQHANNNFKRRVLLLTKDENERVRRNKAENNERISICETEQNKIISKIH